MGCLSIINQLSEEFTVSESKISNYILKNTNKVLGLNANELAKISKVSPASVVRFTRKLGYDSYSEMMIQLARDVESQNSEYLDFLLHSDDSFEEMTKKVMLNITSTLNETYNLLKPKQLEAAIDVLRKAETIYLFGIGASGIVAEDMLQKLVRINKKCVYYPDYNLGVASSVHITDKDAVVAFSYGGKTKEVNIAVQTAKSKGAKCIAVTKCGKSPLASIADMCLLLPNRENEIRIGAVQSRYAQLFIVDLLFVGVVKDNFDKNEEYLQKTREIIARLRI
ncbi:MurR/RpiR family transcriptional regulator [Vallitalea maricola]|uniref:MurR/RpiR family transcriptional regulator n=1 Tax=Vallitalea maricola TaxID=3074433 RepID=A0ACB5UE79_9FIRM|nr:MurR/RpiR family transcriptional regulator [Vallitalea sp. AN17-2]